MTAYSLAPDLAIEDFDDEALAFLASEDRLIKLNKPATILMHSIADAFVDSTFCAEDLAKLLETNYQMSEREAVAEARKVLTAWSDQGLLIRNSRERNAGDDK